MLSARYRRAVAQALAALQREAEEAAPVIDLCGSQEADAAADIEGADADFIVGEHFSARQVGAWIRTHEKDELADRWDWYERVQRALNGLVRDGRVHMGRLGRFRLADAGRVTARLTLRWDEREEMTLEVSSSCTDARLREIVSKKTGGRLPASKMRLVYPPGFNADDRELGDLPDDTVLDLQIVKSEGRVAAAHDGPPSGRVVSDPNASPIDEVVEHEAEGTRGWNDGGDGWVNLVAAEEDEEDGEDEGATDGVRKTKGTRRDSPKKKSGARGDADDAEGHDEPTEPTEPTDDAYVVSVNQGQPPSRVPLAPAPAPAPAAVFDSDAADELGALDPNSALFSPVAAARASGAHDDELDEDRDAVWANGTTGARPRALAGSLSAERERARRKRKRENPEGVVDLTGDDAADDDDDDASPPPTPSSSDSALSGSESDGGPEPFAPSSGTGAPRFEGHDDDDTLRLHEQIVAFARRAGSDAADAVRREACRARVESCVRRVFPSARLACFGSGASGLALREADIDLVVLGVGPECSTAGGGFNKSDRTELVSILRKIERQLRRERVVARAQGIYTAKVPIVKAHTTGDDATGFALDLTVGATNGLKAVDWIKARVSEFPELRPLVLVLKKLLKTHSLDDASTGGCGGYLLVSLAVAHLKMRGASGGAPRPRRSGEDENDEENVSGGKKVAVLPPPPKVDLGVVVTSFLRRFGGDGFDYARSAVAANRSSGLARAADLVVTPGPYGNRPFILCEDPQEVGRNITASAYRFKEVRALFRAAAEAIAAGGDLTFLPEMADGRPNAPARGGGGFGGGFGGRGGFAAAKAANPAATGSVPRWLQAQRAQGAGAPGANRNGGGGGARSHGMQWTREAGASGAGKRKEHPGKSPGKKKGSPRGASSAKKGAGKKGGTPGKGKSPGKGKGGGGRGGGGRGWTTGD